LPAQQGYISRPLIGVLMKPIDFQAHQGQLVQKEHNDGIAGRAELADVALSHCLIQDKYLRDVTFRTGSIQHCRFEHTNLRRATFDRINLTGSRFVACNLEHANFEGCTLWYVVFEQCEINYNSVLRSIPSENNIRRRLLRVLRINAESMGEKSWADAILLLELAAEREDLWDAARHASAYYRERYDVLDRAIAGIKLGAHYLRFWLWGYGLYLSRLALSATAAVVLLATLTNREAFQFNVASEVGTRHLGWFESAYFSVITLTTVGYGDIAPANAPARMLAAGMAVCGVVMFGFIAAAFYRRLAR
jgi:hypothetical protein